MHPKHTWCKRQMPVAVGMGTTLMPVLIQTVLLVSSPLAPEPFVLDFEEAQLTEQNVRDLVYEEMKKYQVGTFN